MSMVVSTQLLRLREDLMHHLVMKRLNLARGYMSLFYILGLSEGMILESMWG